MVLKESKPVLKRPTSLFVSKQDAKKHSKMVMQEMTEQAKIVSDLRYIQYFNEPRPEGLIVWFFFFTTNFSIHYC